MDDFSLYSKYPLSVLKGDFFNSRNLDTQRAIYIADILNRFVVCIPSRLKELSLSRLRDLFYSKADYIVCI